MQQTIEELISAAKSYKNADSLLEAACGETMDPIACTVFARNGKYTDILPAESFDAAHYLNKVVALHEILVKNYGLSNDYVRSLWFPILNA